MNTTVRCFLRLRPADNDCGKRCGIWAMTGEKRGLFFHGDRNEVEPPHWSVAELVKQVEHPDPLFFRVEEISPQQSLAELGDWPAGQRQLQEIFDRHVK